MAEITPEELAKLLKDNFRLSISVERRYAERGDGSWVTATVALTDNEGNDVLSDETPVEIGV